MSNETNGVDQAVFGYSNGHRLLSSTLQLSSIDVYELAAASDLAPGAKVSSNSSYLTGLFLPDSKLYALIRTWLAPEMPRPGCVWSHVLLLDHTLMATQIDLSVVADLHRRPDGYVEDAYFSNTFPLNRRLRGPKADREETGKVLLACYTDVALNEGDQGDGVLERAILAAWSQQWPRLRRQFVFRSIATTAPLKGQFVRFSNDAGTLRGASSVAWLEDAATDATSSAVTPLRRFLWRYGKDIEAERQLLPALVELYQDTRVERLEYDLAVGIFARFPLGQAETLKNDALGLTATKLSQLPSVNPKDLLRLIASRPEVVSAHDQKEFAGIFSQISNTDLGELSATLMHVRNGLGGIFDVVLNAVIPALQPSTLVDENVPAEFALLALEARIELLTPEVINHLSNVDLLRTLGWGISVVQRREIVRAALKRPTEEAFAEIAIERPEQTLRDVIDLSAHSKLHDSWPAVFRSKVPAFADAIATLDGPGSMVPAASLLGFPMEPAGLGRAWLAAFRRHRVNLSRDDGTRFLVYLLAFSIRHGIANFKDIVAEVVDDLRHRVLRNELPPESAEMLSQHLPRDDAYWDLHKRLLKMFRKAYREGQEFDEILGSMNLTDDQYAYATDQDPHDMVRRIWNAFNPWAR